MRILFDHGTPGGIARLLPGHEVTEAIERGWDQSSNGELLTRAEATGCEPFAHHRHAIGRICGMRSFRYESRAASCTASIFVGERPV